MYVFIYFQICLKDMILGLRIIMPVKQLRQNSELFFFLLTN